MQALSFDTGLVEYCVNGGGTLRFNPADGRFVGKLQSLFEALSKEVPAEEALTEQIDAVFGSGTCEMVFGSLSPNALAGGLPLWANFLMAVLEEVHAAVQTQQAAASPRVEHYLEKYAAYRT